jgi:hypothetical protein
LKTVFDEAIRAVCEWFIDAFLELGFDPTLVNPTPQPKRSGNKCIIAWASRPYIRNPPMGAMIVLPIYYPIYLFTKLLSTCMFSFPLGIHRLSSHWMLKHKLTAHCLALLFSL